MPLISISTSAIIENKKDFIEKSSNLISNLTRKPEKFVMVKLSNDSIMYFDKKYSPSCYVEIRSIGSLNPPEMSSSIAEFCSRELGLGTERIYINFVDVNAAMWAWNGKTFG